MKKIVVSVFWLTVLVGCDVASDKSAPSPTGDYFNLSASKGQPGVPPAGIEQYNTIVENPFVDVSKEPTSTFSIDADGGSYANVRRFLSTNTKPVADAIRTEELVNYFPLQYDDPTNGEPLAVNGEVSTCPWDNTHKLIRIGIKGQSIARESLLPSNIVLLIDVSGSMSDVNKLALLKQALPNFWTICERRIRSLL